MPDVATKMSWTLSGLLYFFILAFYNRSAMNNYGVTYGYYSASIKNKIFFILVFIYCLCAFYCGDWAHLQTLLKESLGAEYIAGYGIEKVYYYLNEKLNGNYLLFRTVVWGGGLVCLYNSFKFAHLNPSRSLYFLFGIYITAFVYTRAGFALAIFYLGLVLLFQPKEERTVWKLAIAIALIVSSTYFHRSILVLACLSPLTFVPISRKNILVILLGVAVFSFFVERFFDSAWTTLMTSDEYSHRMEVYENIAGGGISITFDQNGLFLLWYKAIVHLPFWVSIIAVYKRSGFEKIPLVIQAVFRFSIILYAFLLMMLLTYGSASAFYYRYEGMLYIPITILMCFLKENRYISQERFSFIFWLCALSCGKDFIYRMLFM